MIPSAVDQAHMLRLLWITNARQNVFWRSSVEDHLQQGDLVLATDWQGMVFYA